MEKRYTAKVPASLTQRLYEAGMPLKVNTDYEVNKYTNKVDKKLDIEPPSYAKTLDWLASKNEKFVNTFAGFLTEAMHDAYFKIED